MHVNYETRGYMFTGVFIINIIRLKGYRLNDIAIHVHISELRDITCHMGSHSVTCHLTQVNVPRLNPARRPVSDLPTPKGWKAELT